MKVLVPVKRAIDSNVKARVKADGSGVDLANVKMSMNPFDEIAVEEAVRMKEGKGHAANTASEIVVVSIGPAQASETLRTALAIGADRGILVQSDADLEPLAVAKALKAIVDEEKPDLVLMGKQSIDGDNIAVGQMLAALLDWPQATFAGKVEIGGGLGPLTDDQDVDVPGQLGGGGHDLGGGFTHGGSVVIGDDENGHYSTPLDFSLATSSPASETFSPAERFGGSATLSTFSRGATSTPRSATALVAISFFLAFMMLGSEA